MGMMKLFKARKKKEVIQVVCNGSPGCCLPSSTRTKMVTASCYLPKADKTRPLGEDAHFISKDEQKMGVADGVGGWKKKGIEAGEYARELMTNACNKIEGQPDDAVNPWKALNEAFLSTKAQGSSTACLVTLRGLGEPWGDILHAVNVGDSGFLVIRDGKIVYQTTPQQSRFNHPYQLGHLSNKDALKSVQVFLVSIEAGDTVVVGTDGLFDNLFPREIEDIVQICRKRENAPQMIADTLANVALQISLVKNIETPFSQAAKKAGIYHSVYSGGKYDDITVIAAQIV